MQYCSAKQLKKIAQLRFSICSRTSPAPLWPS
jgi:hypothetical protein